MLHTLFTSRPPIFVAFVSFDVVHVLQMKDISVTGSQYSICLGDYFNPTVSKRRATNWRREGWACACDTVCSCPPACRCRFVTTSIILWGRCATLAASLQTTVQRTPSAAWCWCAVPTPTYRSASTGGSVCLHNTPWCFQDLHFVVLYSQTDDLEVVKTFLAKGYIPPEITSPMANLLLGKEFTKYLRSGYFSWLVELITDFCYKDIIAIVCIFFFNLVTKTISYYVR